jgi:hypothetical protein
VSGVRLARHAHPYRARYQGGDDGDVSPLKSGSELSAVGASLRWHSPVGIIPHSCETFGTHASLVTLSENVRPPLWQWKQANLLGGRDPSACGPDRVAAKAIEGTGWMMKIKPERLTAWRN